MKQTVALLLTTLSNKSVRNGRVMPNGSCVFLQIYPKQANTTVSCDNLDCTDHCVCTYIVKLEKDKTVQMTLLNMGMDLVLGMIDRILLSLPIAFPISHFKLSLFIIEIKDLSIRLV
jgi:hypothetical protein